MNNSSKRLTREEYIEKILIILYQTDVPMLNIKEIADKIEVTQQTLTKYLYFILNTYLEEHISGSSKYYYLNKKGKEKAKKILEKRKI